MKHKFFPFVAGLALSCALTGPTPAIAAPGDDRATAVAAPLPAQELNADTLFLLLLGEIAGSRGDLEVSVEAYLHAARQTRDPRVARRATEIALAARNMDAATKATRLWLDIAPEDEDARRMLAGILAARGDQMNEVQIELARILANSEGAALERNLLGLNRALAPIPDKGLVREVVERLVEPYQHEPSAHFALAQAAAAADDPLAAIAALDHSLQQRPDWEPAVVLKSQLLVQMDAVTDALAMLRDHLARHPDSRNVALAYARSLVSAREYPAALTEFQGLLAHEPDNVDLMYAVGLVAAETGDFDTARTQFENALAAGHPERNGIRMNLGNIAERQNHPADALRWYGEITPSHQHVDAQLRIAQLLADGGDLTAARSHLQSIDAEPEDRRRLLFAEVVLLRGAQQYAEALQLLEAALLEAPNDPDLLYESAMLAERVGEMDKMEQRLRTLIELDPDHAHAYNALGYTFADRAIRLEEAEQLIQRALEIAPDDPFILDSLGWVRFRRGDLEGALRHLEEAYTMRSDPEIAAHLGEVLWALGRTADADAILNQALSDHPDNSLLTETIQRLRLQ